MKKMLLMVCALMASIIVSSASVPLARTTAKGMKEVNSLSHRTSPAAVRHIIAQQDEPADYYEVPFKHTLGKSESEITNKYIVIDANGDGRTWKPGGFTGYSVCMKPNDESVTTCDDWLVSPAVKLTGGKVYTLSFECGTTLSSGTEEKMEVCFGAYPEVESLTVAAFPAFTFSGKDFQTKSIDFTASADGFYYFGFHAMSATATSGNIKICNFSIEENPDAVPAPENAIEVPFEHSLGKNQAAITNQYVIVDANGDGRTWKPGGFTGYSVCMKPNDESVTTCDDWMISLPVHLFAGKTYCLKYEDGSALASGIEDKLEVYAGTSPTAEAMNIEIVAAHTMSGQSFITREQDFTVGSDGYYYFGFHAISETAKSGNPKICNFSITEASERVDPPVAGTMTYELAPKGELKATVHYTAPTMSQGGNPLTSISKVEIKTNWLLTHTLTGIAPGETVTFETDLYNNGYNRIEATAYVGDVAGETLLIKDFYAGPDNPLPVTNVKILMSDDYKHVTVSWDAVGEVGEKGGYVDASRAQYYIFDAFGSYYDPALAVTTETSYTFDYSDIDGQDFIAYQITAGIDETYYSLESNSDIVIVGEPDLLPWGESFSDAYYSQMWVVDPETTTYTILCGTVYDNELQTNADDYEADPEYLNSRDGDNGFFYIMPLEKDAVYGFSSTKIDISSAEHPVFEFYYQGKGSALDAMVAAGSGAFDVVKTIDLKAEPTDDWTLCRIDLSDYKSAPYILVELRLRAIHNDDEYMWSVPIDDIRVRDLVSSDLRLMSVNAPDVVKGGESFTVGCKVENLGTDPVADAVVEFYRNGEKAGSVALDVLAPDAVVEVKFTQSTSVLDGDGLDLTLDVVSGSDVNDDNNTATVKVAVEVSKFPAPASFTAEAQDGGAVALKWEVPDFAYMTAPETVTEDFENEDYEMFNITGVGGWTFYDGDRRATYTFLKDENNPYRTSPMAFQLFDPVKAGVPEEYLIDVPVHSGNNMLVAWSCQVTNDNWAISPALSGNAQIVSFYACGFSVAFPEEFEVLYSTTGKDIDDFVKVEEVTNYPANGAVPEVWTEYTAALPAGAKYFAIHHISYDSYALYVDDITFEKAGIAPADLAVEGYNVYRDGVKINESLVKETSMTDMLEENGEYSYRVSAVYNYGESVATDPLTVSVENAGVLNAEVSRYSVTVQGNCIVVAGAEGQTVTVVAVDGKTLHSSVAAGVEKIKVTAGVYVVKVADESVKVVVKG